MRGRDRSKGRFTPVIGLVLVLGGCAGDASDGESPTIEFTNTKECIRFDGGFPSDLVLLPGMAGEAATVQLVETAVLGLDLDREPPRLLARDALPGFPSVPCDCDSCDEGTDSDSDGVADVCRSKALGFGSDPPIPGDLLVLDSSRVGLSTSNVEQIVFVDPRTNRLLPVELDTPEPSDFFQPDDWPFWPAPGLRPIRTALSTRACVYGDGMVGSRGNPIGTATSCDPTRNGFRTGFTAGTARAEGRLFVATSNFLVSTRFPSQYAPSTLLVFEYDEASDPPRAHPDQDRAVIPLAGYNATGVTAYETPSGRPLILVTLTGAIGTGTGPDLVRTDSAIDVIDALSLDRIATIPMGRAGLGFGELAIDRTRRIALTGAATSRALFGIDLAALDDPDLGLGPEPLPIVLDGSDPRFPDARLFAASNPFSLPKRSDGPPETQCATITSVALSPDAAWGATSDFCDGTISLLSLSLPTSRATPLDPAAILRVDRVQKAAAPLVAEASDRLRAIDRVLIRPGVPGIDFDGPDVYFTAGLNDGAVCGTRLNALD